MICESAADKPPFLRIQYELAVDYRALAPFALPSPMQSWLELIDQ
jgi:hypothetical protein